MTALSAVIERRTSEFAVTNKRVLIKTGLIRRHSLETLLSKIEDIGLVRAFSVAYWVSAQSSSAVRVVPKNRFIRLPIP